MTLAWVDGVLFMRQEETRSRNRMFSFGHVLQCGLKWKQPYVCAAPYWAQSSVVLVMVLFYACHFH